MDKLEENSMEEIYPDLNVDKDVNIYYDGRNNQKDILEENIQEKWNAHKLRWVVYNKQK